MHRYQDRVVSAALDAALPIVAQVTVALARAVRCYGKAGETRAYSADRCLESRALSDAVLLLYVLHLRALAGLPVGSGSVLVHAGTLTV